MIDYDSEAYAEYAERKQQEKQEAEYLARKEREKQLELESKAWSERQKEIAEYEKHYY